MEKLEFQDKKICNMCPDRNICLHPCEMRMHWINSKTGQREIPEGFDKYTGVRYESDE